MFPGARGKARGGRGVSVIFIVHTMDYVQQAFMPDAEITITVICLKPASMAALPIIA